ncbi:6906_t:CDS:2 [Cetraspora pellucida]|uniref:6906_t:CDS:1 n=1 Tax=Cetraspora pellucida TaxID=1433469 RepID=A0A9N9ISU7_9GLOM|nr:6906_t:CDS:2 [Cetraspora pellucida]
MESSRIGFLSGVSLLVSSMTGPGLVTMPLLFQTAGWITSLIIVFLIVFLSSSAALLLCEAIESLPAQSLDGLFVTLFGMTCGISISPDSGWLCIKELGDESSPFGNRWMLLTAGFMTTLLFVIPMTWMRLSNNAKIQVVSFFTILFVIFTWIVALIFHGLDSKRIPLIGENQSQAVGIVMFNYAFITTVPSLTNELEKDGSIRKIVYTSILITTLGYIFLGILGAMSFDLELSTNIITSIRQSELLIPFQSGYWLNLFTNWTSLIFISSANFIIPFWLYILSRRKAKVIPPVTITKHEEGIY